MVDQIEKLFLSSSNDDFYLDRVYGHISEENASIHIICPVFTRTDEL